MTFFTNVLLTMTNYDLTNYLLFSPWLLPQEVEGPLGVRLKPSM